MITEQDRAQRETDKIENAIRLCEDAIAKAEKYERQQENKDWQEFWKDVEVVADLHEKQIQMGISMLPDAPNNTVVKRDPNNPEKDTVVSSKQDWLDFITRHEIQRDTLKNWAKEPTFIINMAKIARERLANLKEQRAKQNDAADNH